LTEERKHLILFAFVSYEAVRLWWWGGNCGVVSFETTPFFCSIPTLASNLNRVCGNDLEIFHTRVPAEVPAKKYPGSF